MITLTEVEADALRYMLSQPLIPPSHPSHSVLVAFAEQVSFDLVQLDENGVLMTKAIIEMFEADEIFHDQTMVMRVPIANLKAKIAKGEE